MSTNNWLLPLSWVYGSVIRLRQAGFQLGMRRIQRLPGTVISIGNIVAGGTGKSPVVIRLAECLRGLGLRPAILTRGYRSGLEADDSAALLGQDVVMQAQDGRLFHADEAQMQAAVLGDVPVVIGARRYQAACRFLAANEGPAPTHWLLDDGFQRRQLHRDFDVVLLDAKDPFGGSALLPAGRLREPVANLSRADAVLFTRSEKGLPTPEVRDAVAAYVAQMLSVPFRLGNPVPMNGAPPFTNIGGGAVAVAGIAEPERFFAEVAANGIEVIASLAGSDHARLDRERVLKLTAGRHALVTTAKDFWRDPDLFRSLGVPVYVVPLVVDWTDRQILALLKSSGKPLALFDESQAGDPDHT